MAREKLMLAIDEVQLVTLGHEHVEALAELRWANLDDLRISSASRHPYDATAEDISHGLRRRINDAASDQHPFVILHREAVAGDLNLTQLVRGPEESANVGLFVDRQLRGQGIATTAIALVCRLAFGELALHRLQAGIQPANAASQAAFIHNGFEQIGLARRYLFVNGAWRDHVLFQKLAPER